MNIFNEKEFNDICKKLGIKAAIQEVTINYESGSFFGKMKRSIENDRRGEVVFCVVRPNGKIITITCSEYPDGIFRIPTGGIGHNEDIIDAVYREVKEELGLDVEITDFPGVLKIRFQHGDNYVMFYSYLFILKEKSGRILKDASDNEVSEIMEVDIQGLEKVAQKLEDIPGKWHDWGKFRYETTNAILRYFSMHV